MSTPADGEMRPPSRKVHVLLSALPWWCCPQGRQRRHRSHQDQAIHPVRGLVPYRFQGRHQLPATHSCSRRWLGQGKHCRINSFKTFLLRLVSIVHYQVSWSIPNLPCLKTTYLCRALPASATFLSYSATFLSYSATFLSYSATFLSYAATFLSYSATFLSYEMAHSKAPFL